MALDDFRYTSGAMEALATHYFDDHLDVLAVDAYADFDRSLVWLQREAPELEALLRRWMVGHMETDLALGYGLRPRTLARLLDQTFLLLARYLNDERPLEIPVLTALQSLDRPFVPPLSPPDLFQAALTSLSMTFTFSS